MLVMLRKERENEEMVQLLTSTGLESGYGIDPVNHPRVTFAQIELRDAG